MESSEERRKKLEAGKEKLAAFQKKKSKTKKSNATVKSVDNPSSQQNGGELSTPELSSPSDVYSVTDSDQFSFMSDEEWSAEDSGLKFTTQHHEKQTDYRSGVTEFREAGMEGQHMIDVVVYQSLAADQSQISDVESALVKRDELIAHLLHSLQTTVGQNIPNNEVISQVQALAEHVCKLQNQLQQVDQSLQEQLDLHRFSAAALQAAREQMLQLQAIINLKDTQLRQMKETVVHSVETKEAYEIGDFHEKSDRSEHLMYRIKTLEEELHGKTLKCESWSQQEQAWADREQELLSSLSAKSEELNAVLLSQQKFHDVECEIVSPELQQVVQESYGGVHDQEQLRYLEFELSEMKRNYELDADEISMLKRQISELEAERNGYISHMLSYESLRVEYEAVLSTHSQCLKKIQEMTSQNIDLQEKLSALSLVEKEFTVLNYKFQKLSFSYQRKIQKRYQQNEHDENLDDDENYAAEKEILNAKITELQNEIYKLQSIPSSSNDDVDDVPFGSHLKKKLLEGDSNLIVKLHELAEAQNAVQNLDSSYHRTKISMTSNEEVISGFTEKLQAIEPSLQELREADVEETGTEKVGLEQIVLDLESRLKEKDVECKQLTENVIKLQDEFMSASHGHLVEMSQKEHQFERLEERMAILDSEREDLLEKVRILEDRLKVECQQNAEDIQLMAHEKEMEHRQYTEKIVKLQDELLSVQHVQSLELLEKEYQLQNLEEQMEKMNAEKANLAQQVNDLEYRFNLKHHENMQHTQVLNNKEMECGNYQQAIVTLQDDFLSVHHAHGLEISEKDTQLERLGKQIEILTSENTNMLQKISAMEQKINYENEHRIEMEEKRSEIESQLSMVLADREHMLKTAESLATEIWFLKKDLQDSATEQKLIHEKHDQKAISCDSNDKVENIVIENERVTNLQKHEVQEVSYLENKCTHEETNIQNTSVTDLIVEVESQQKLIVQYQNEREHLKSSVVDLNEELVQTKTFLEATRAELLRSQTESAEHIAALMNKVQHFETQEKEMLSLQQGLLELKSQQQHMLEREAGQDELQAQLENTVSQWQKLQLIVQEKEIEVQKLQENLDEQMRIHSTMTRTFDEERDLHQAEVQSLRLALSSSGESDKTLEHQIYDLQTKLGNKTIELQEVRNAVSEKDIVISNLNNCLAQKEIEFSDLKTSFAVIESEKSQLANSFILMQSEVDSLKGILADSESQLKTLDRNLKDKETETEILKSSLNNIDEKEKELVNFRISTESHILDLKTVITEKEVEINDLRLNIAENAAEISALKQDLEEKNLGISAFKDDLSEKQSELISVINIVASRDAEIEALKISHAEHEAEILILKRAASDAKSEIDILKSKLADDEAEAVVLKNNLIKSESLVNDLKFSLAGKESEVEAIKNLLTDKNSKIDELQNSLTIRESEIDELKNNLRSRESEIDELKNSFLNRESENEELKNSLTSRESDYDALKSNLTSRESAIEELKNSLTNRESEVDDIMNNLRIRESEIDELKNTLRSRESDYDELKNSFSNRESEIDELKNSLTSRALEIDELKKSFTNRESEIDELKNKVISKESEIASKLTDKESEINELRYILSSMESEILETKNNASQKIHSEIVELKNSLLIKESEIMGLKTSITCKDSEINELKNSLTKNKSEIDVLKHSLTNTELEFDELKNYVTIKESEIVGLNNILTNKETEINELKNMFTSSESEVKDIIANKELEIASLKCTITTKEAEFDVFESMLAEREAELLSIKSGFTAIQSEAKMLANSLLEKRRETAAARSILMENVTLEEGDTESSKSKSVERRLDAESLPTIVRENELETHYYRESLANVKITISSEDKSRETEIAMLVTDIADKNSEIDSLKSSLAERDLLLLRTTNSLNKTELEVVKLLNKIQENEKEFENFTESLAEKDLELANLNNNLAMNASDLAEVKSVLAVQVSEMNSLQSSLQRKDAEAQELKMKMSEKESEIACLLNSFSNKGSGINVFEEKDSEVNEMKSRINETLLQVGELQTKLNEREEELSLAVQGKHDILGELERVKQQLDVNGNDARSIISEKDSEIKVLQENLTEEKNQSFMLQMAVNAANDELTAVKNSLMYRESEVSTMTNRLAEANSQLELLQIAVSKTENELKSVKNHETEKESKIGILVEGLNEAVKNLDTLNACFHNSKMELMALRSCAAEMKSEIIFLKEKLTDREFEITTLTERLNDAGKTLATSHTDLAHANEELIALKNSLLEKESEMNSLMGSLHEANNQVDTLRITVGHQDEKMLVVKNSVEERDSEIGELKDKLSQFDEKESEIRILTEKLCEANSQVNSLHSTVNESTEKMKAFNSIIADKESEISLLNSELIDVKERYTEFETLMEKHDEAKNMVESLHETLSKTNDEMTTLKTRVIEMESEISSLQDKLTVANQKDSEYKTLSDRLNEANNQITLLSKSLDTTDKELTAMKNYVAEKESQISDLKIELLEVKDHVNSLLSSLNCKNDELEAARNSLAQKEFEVSTLTEKLNVTTANAETLHTTVYNREEELQTIKRSLMEKESEVATLTDKFSEAANQVKSLQTALSNTFEELTDLKSCAQEKESDYCELEHKVSESASQTEILQTRLSVKEDELNLVAQERNNYKIQLSSLETKVEALEVNLREATEKVVRVMEDLIQNQEEKNHLQNESVQKGNQISELSSHIINLEENIKKLSSDLETAYAAEECLKSRFHAKEEECSLATEKLLQDSEDLNRLFKEKESDIAELIQKVSVLQAQVEYLMKELNDSQKIRLVLQSSLSNMIQDDQEKTTVVVQQELQLQKQAERVLELTNTTEQNSSSLQAMTALCESLKQMNHKLTSESQIHLEDMACQREALEQKVGEIESLLAQKEHEISEIVQLSTNEKIAKEHLSSQLQATMSNYQSLSGLLSYLQEDIQAKEAALIDQKLLITEQTAKINDLTESVEQSTVSIMMLNDVNSSLESQVKSLHEDKNDLELRLSKLQNDFDNQELSVTQFMVEGKQLAEKLTQINYDMEAKEATVFDLRHDCDMYMKDINDLKLELEQKDIVSISLRQEIESAHASLERSREEKEMLKANFDSCMEEMQQRFGDQEIELKRLRSQMAEETKSVNQDQSHMKEIYEQQLSQMEEKLLHNEKQCEKLEKELAEIKTKAASTKDVYEHQLSEQELHLQSTNSELVKLKDHLSKVVNNHQCEVAGLKRLHEIQTNELEETCLALERTVAEQKRLINEQMQKFNREKNDIEQSYEIQLSEVEEKRRFSEMEISRLKKHMDEMKLDHDKDMQNLEKNYEARLYELEDKYCSVTNERDRLRKSLMAGGDASEERQALEIRLDELITMRRDLQIKNATLEDEISIMRDQAFHREEEMREVLKNAAEKQQERTAEMTSEISHLQQQLSSCKHEQADIVARIKEEYDAQIVDLQSRNKQLQEKVSFLEMHIESEFPGPCSVSQPKPLNVYPVQGEKPDFVEEQIDIFQPEISLDESSQCSAHPIREEVIRERFEPENPDQFLAETIDETDNPVGWPHRLSVGMSPSHLQTKQFEYRSSDLIHGDEFSSHSLQSREEAASDLNNSNCNARETFNQSPGRIDEERLEKHLNDIREELEETYVIKMRQQEASMTVEHEKKQAEYRQEVEQHFAQRMKAVKYDWERKFNKALQKVKKEMEKQHAKELKLLRESQFSKHLHQIGSSVSPVVNEGATWDEESDKMVENLQQCQKDQGPEVSDGSFEQAEVSQSRDSQTSLQTEVQSEATRRDSISSDTSTASTPTVTASSPIINRDAGRDEAASPRSEVSETSSARERFLEELEEMSHQSSQDLPLEWELTNTVIDDTGNFEVEPEHHSVWEVFDGRCVRQDCQEVRHKFHKLYQWVVSCQGDGFDVVSGDEFKLLIGNVNRELSNCFQYSQNENSEPLHLCDRGTGLNPISQAELIARVAYLESVKHKLEEKLAAQMDLNIKMKWQVDHWRKETNIQHNKEILVEEVLEQDTQKRSVLPIGIDSLTHDSRTCKDDLSLQNFANHDVYPSYDLVTIEREMLQNEDTETNNSLGAAMHNLHLMLMKKEEQMIIVEQENACLKSNIEKLMSNSKVLPDDRLRFEILQQQLASMQKLLQVKDDMINNLQARLRSMAYPQQATYLLADGNKSAAKTSQVAELREPEVKHWSSDDFTYTYSSVDGSAITVPSEAFIDQPSDNSASEGNLEQSENGSSKSETSEQKSLHLAQSSSDSKSTIEQEDSSASTSGSSNLLSTFPVDDAYATSNYEMPNIQDKDLAEELLRLQKDMKETRAMYCKENVLLQEALHKETALKSLMIRRVVSDSNTAETINTFPSSYSGVSQPETYEDSEMLKQRLAVCLEQNQMLENENAALRTKIREQTAMFVVFQNRLQQKDQETEMQKSFHVQLNALQKQRSDLLQLIRDMESGKVSTLSDSLQDMLKEESLRLVQEDLMSKMEELDHLYKLLNQKQIELQHCETERRHLEQICLIKDVTEMQLMKQKRLMEEQLSEIEVHLQERETNLMEEKMILLQELKDRNLHLSVITDFQQTFAHPSPRQQNRQPSSVQEINLSTFQSEQQTGTSALLKDAHSNFDADRYHLEAVERLRTKLKEFESQATRISESHNSAGASPIKERNSKHK